MVMVCVPRVEGVEAGGSGIIGLCMQAAFINPLPGGPQVLESSVA